MHKKNFSKKRGGKKRSNKKYFSKNLKRSMRNKTKKIRGGVLGYETAKSALKTLVGATGVVVYAMFQPLGLIQTTNKVVVVNHNFFGFTYSQTQEIVGTVEYKTFAPEYLKKIIDMVKSRIDPKYMQSLLDYIKSHAGSKVTDAMVHVQRYGGVVANKVASGVASGVGAIVSSADAGFRFISAHPYAIAAGAALVVTAALARTYMNHVNKSGLKLEALSEEEKAIMVKIFEEIAKESSIIFINMGLNSAGEKRVYLCVLLGSGQLVLYTFKPKEPPVMVNRDFTNSYEFKAQVAAEDGTGMLKGEAGQKEDNKKVFRWVNDILSREDIKGDEGEDEVLLTCCAGPTGGGRVDIFTIDNVNFIKSVEPHFYYQDRPFWMKTQMQEAKDSETNESLLTNKTSGIECKMSVTTMNHDGSEHPNILELIIKFQADRTTGKPDPKYIDTHLHDLGLKIKTLEALSKQLPAVL